MAKLEYASMPVRIEQKSEGANGMLHIVGYGCAFNNIDRVDDIIVPTACDEFLKSEYLPSMQFCYQHNPDQIIGKFDYDSIHTDDKGLYFEADLLPTSWGKDAQVLIEADMLKTFSIGYYVKECHRERRDNKDIRVLDNIYISEISVVSRPANPEAVLISAKDDPTAPEQEQGYQSKTTEELERMRTDIDAELFSRYIGNL